ncbi:MAG: discoidin domain-containing protein [Formivibrio sp.]|nr:discoidin domain-containing protein [Formivibrio sp.]
MDPAPNYALCTDPGDATQLTDGQYVSGYFWTQKGTVGCVGKSPVTIAIDLEKTQPIGGLSFNTAAGTAGVGWPFGIFMLVSDDGQVWHYVGDLVALSATQSSPPSSGYAVHRFQTRELATKGRFIKLMVAPSGPFVFVDEIEIYPASQPVLMPGGLVCTDINAFFRKLCTENGLKRRLRDDLAAVSGELAGLNENVTRPLKTELDSIAAAIPSVTIESPDTFTTIFPINDLHRRIFAVQAALWRARGLSGTVLWQSNRWDMLSPTGIPVPGKPVLDLPLMSNEYRADAFNLSNAGETNAQITLNLEGLSGGVNPAYITPCEVPFTDTQSGVPVAAALLPLSSTGVGYHFQVPPGLTRQIWFTFHPTNVSAGTYAGRVSIVSSGITDQVPVQLKIYPFRFPDHPALHLGGWDYTDTDYAFDLTPKNRDALIQTLREHFVDSPWATSQVLPTGKYDGNGRMIQPPDPAAFRKWLDRWPDARLYCVFANVKTNFAGFAMETPAFQQAVGNWINWWVKQLKQWQIKPSQLCMLLVDEPHSAEQDRTIIAYARVIRQAQPGVVIWEDPAWANPEKATQELFDLCQVLCPHLPTWIDASSSFANFYIQQKAVGHRLWFYSCRGPSRLLDPYAYYRLQPWFAWKYGAEGSAYWAFCDSSGASSWNEYTAIHGGYTPLFLNLQSATSGKQMEAIREGVEDYENLWILSARLQQLPTNAINADIDTARQLLATATDQVTSAAKPSSAQYWQVTKNRSLADLIRVQMLDAVDKLKVDSR